jgi:catalase (peroxidase I)
MGSVNTSLPNNERGDFVGGAVRLTFHDAGEIDITTTADDLGVDGCVDLTKPDNNGLAAIIDQLETIRSPYCHLISRADWWVLAGKVAVELRATANGFTVPFRFGRTDVDDCTYGGGRLPSAEGGVEEITRVFVTQMGLTFRDASALLGAHTLGRTVTANSG